jgi:tRNA (guanine37-N1)-methyltransferase
MRVDVVSIFPDYLAPLQLSLLGRAQADGVVSLHTHDLRDWAHDRHRTVDDSPYGGGPGMVMRPEPWGEALDAVVIDAPSGGATPTLIIPTPAGHRFDQEMAADLAGRPWLVIACGRYEGIDQRVAEHFARRGEVLEVSIGDYVLNGGEAAALVIVEAVARLLPGFVGNPDSLLEESHATGPSAALLEYPVYTKPPSWRGLDVPEVLLSGHHAQIAEWRRQAAVRRTAERRPDLVHPSQTLHIPGAEPAGLGDAEVGLATPADAGEVLTLQRCCWVSEAQANEGIPIPALLESLDDVRRSFDEWTTVIVRAAGRLVGSARGRLASGDVWDVGRIMVAPDLAGRGLGRWLLRHIERAAPAEATSYRLFTGAGSARNIRMYRRAGYRPDPRVEPPTGVVVLSKRVRAPGDFG